MRKERMNEQEITALLRQQNIDDLREVKLGIVEVNGQLSVIKEDWAKERSAALVPLTFSWH